MSGGGRAGRSLRGPRQPGCPRVRSAAAARARRGGRGLRSLFSWRRLSLFFPNHKPDGGAWTNPLRPPEALPARLRGGQRGRAGPGQLHSPRPARRRHPRPRSAPGAGRKRPFRTTGALRIAQLPGPTGQGAGCEHSPGAAGAFPPVPEHRALVGDSHSRPLRSLRTARSPALTLGPRSCWSRAIPLVRPAALRSLSGAGVEPPETFIQRGPRDQSGGGHRAPRRGAGSSGAGGPARGADRWGPRPGFRGRPAGRIGPVTSTGRRVSLSCAGARRC